MDDGIRVTLGEEHAWRALQLADWMGEQAKDADVRQSCVELAVALREQLITGAKRAGWRDASRRYRANRKRRVA